MMKLHFKLLSTAIVALGALAFYCIPAMTSAAEESVKSKAEEAKNDTTRAVKKGARAVEDKTCEMVNGKMKCAAKKVKHTMQNAGDSVKDAID